MFSCSKHEWMNSFNLSKSCTVDAAYIKNHRGCKHNKGRGLYFHSVSLVKHLTNQKTAQKQQQYSKWTQHNQRYTAGSVSAMSTWSQFLDHYKLRIKIA